MDAAEERAYAQKVRVFCAEVRELLSTDDDLNQSIQTIVADLDIVI
jgi:hypothetical protein